MLNSYQGTSKPLLRFCSSLLLSINEISPTGDLLCIVLHVLQPMLCPRTDGANNHLETESLLKSFMHSRHSDYRPLNSCSSCSEVHARVHTSLSRGRGRGTGLRVPNTRWHTMSHMLEMSFDDHTHVHMAEETTHRHPFTGPASLCYVECSRFTSRCPYSV
jgi:hypothetical protein